MYACMQCPTASCGLLSSRPSTEPGALGGGGHQLQGHRQGAAEAGRPAHQARGVGGGWGGGVGGGGSRAAQRGGTRHRSGSRRFQATFGRRWYSTVSTAPPWSPATERLRRGMHRNAHESIVTTPRQQCQRQRRITAFAHLQQDWQPPRDKSLLRLSTPKARVPQRSALFDQARDVAAVAAGDDAAGWHES